MKITSVDLYQVTSGKPSVAGTYWKASICRINTDEGISGFGEAGVCYSSGSDAALGLLKDYAQSIIGMNPEGPLYFQPSAPLISPSGISVERPLTFLYTSFSEARPTISSVPMPARSSLTGARSVRPW